MQSHSDQTPAGVRTAWICRVCFEKDGVSNSRVIEKVIGHPMHKNRYARMVCATCLDRGRETRATCGTFILSTHRDIVAAFFDALKRRLVVMPAVQAARPNETL